MQAPSKARIDELRTVYAEGAKGGFKKAIDSSRRMERYQNDRTETVQLRCVQGGANHGLRDIHTQGITFDQLWKFACKTITYQTRSSGRYAKNASKGLQQAKGTKDKYGAMERTATQAVRKCEQLSHTKELLGRMCTQLMECDRPAQRERLLSDIGALCEREGIRGIPHFLEHPHTIETRAQAAAYIATLYAMFPMCSRGFKKYFLSPRIKQARKLWDIEKPSRPETIETIAQKYAAIVQ